MAENSSNTYLNFLQKSVTYPEVIFYGQFPEFISKSFVDIRNNSGSYCVVDDLQDTKKCDKVRTTTQKEIPVHYKARV